MKITITENYRLEVFPVGYRWRASTHQESVGQLADLATSIKRHVDDWDNIIHNWDTREICEFCKGEWEIWEEEDDGELKKGMPACCQKAQEEYSALEKK